MLFVIICFIVFSIFLLQVKIFSVESDFNNLVINLLLVIGLFSVVITNFKTINLIIVIVIILWAFLTKKWKFRIVLKNLGFNFLITLIVALFFIIFYNENGKFFIPHEDYLFYSRLSIDNLFYKKESISAPYNTYNYISKIDFYHFFELWTASLGKQINGQNITKNLFFFSYPLATVLSLIGLKELIIYWFPAKKNIELLGISFFIFLVGIFFISQPWDSFLFFFKIKGVSISEFGGLWMSPKVLFVIPIIISLFIFLNNHSQENLMVFIFSIFLYFPLLPILLLSITLWLIFNRAQSIKLDNSSFIILGSLTILLALYFFNFLLSNNLHTNKSNISNLIDFGNLTKVLPSIILKAIIIPFVTFGSLFLLIFYVCKSFKIAFKNYQLYILIYLISFSLWVVFAINIDSKQPFFLLIGSILILLSLIGILFLLNSNRKWIGILIYFIFLFPGILKAYNFESTLQKIDSNTASFVKNIGKKRILYLPQVDEIKNIYSRNERVYTGINSFLIYNDSLELVNISASYYLDTSNLNQSIINSYLSFKQNSPFFNLCGDFNYSKFDCLKQYVKKYNIDYICTSYNNPLDSSWNNVFKSNYYNFYKSK
jgi:hypothetical protein